MAEEMDEGKGLSVQTSVFPTEAKLLKSSGKKKKCNYVAQLSEAQTAHKLLLVLGESEAMSFIHE